MQHKLILTNLLLLLSFVCFQSVMGQCPTMVVSSFSSDSGEYCETDIVDLQALSNDVMTDNDATALLVWYDSEGNEVVDPSLEILTLSPTCTVVPLNYTLQIICTEDNSLVETLTYTANVYPTDALLEDVYFIVPSPPEFSCDPTIIPNCPDGELTILYFYNGSWSENPPPSINVGDDPLIYNYQVLAEGTLSCGTGSQVIIECTATCMIDTDPLYEFDNHCAGSSIDLTVYSDMIIDNPTGMETIIWYDDEGDVVPDPTNTTLPEPPDCAPVVLTYSVEVPCPTQPGVLAPGGTYIATVYPDPASNASIFDLPSGCETEIVPSCTTGGLDIWYSTDGVNFSPIPPENPAEGDPVLNVNFTINVTGAPAECAFEATYTVACGSGNACPTMVLNPVDETGEYCSGTVIDLTQYSAGVVTDLPDESVALWRDPSGNLVTDPTNVTLPNPPGCGAAPVIYTLEIDCTTDNELNLFGGTFTATVYPQINASLFQLPMGCETEIMPLCPTGNLEILYSIDGINFSVTPPPNPTEGDPVLNVDFTIISVGAPPNCMYMDAYSVNCVDPSMACPTFADIDEADKEAHICEGESFDFEIFYDDLIIDGILESTIFNWTDMNGSMGPIEVPLNLSYNGNGCDPQSYEFQLNLLCEEDLTVNIDVGTFTVFVYPDPFTAEVVLPTEDCETIVTANCPDGTPLLVEYSIDGGNTYTTDPIVLAGGPEAVSIDTRISFENLTYCSALLGTYMVDCPLPLECPVSLNTTSVNVCNNIAESSVLDFSSFVDGETGFGTWMIDDSTIVDLFNPAQVDFVGVLDGTYSFSYLPDDSLCTTGLSLDVLVETCDIQVLLPAAFSPNGDGMHDVLMVRNTENVEAIDFRVFNRWGQEVFFTSVPDVGWDGTYKGTPQPIGVYIYLLQVTFVGGQKEVFNDPVTLIR